MIHRTATAAALALILGGCSVDMGGFSFTKETRAPAPQPAVQAPGPVLEGPLLQADGTCDRPAPASTSAPQAVALGIGECDLIRLKGQPTDVLIGESGKGQREVQVLYSIPGNKEVYLFTDNRLTRIVQ